ncbi:hypothetical protein D3C72_1733130 [compost metagenome]
MGFVHTGDASGVVGQLDRCRIDLAQLGLRQLRRHDPLFAGDGDGVVGGGAGGGCTQVIALPRQCGRRTAKARFKRAVAEGELGVGDDIKVAVVFLLGAFQVAAA